MGDNNKISQGMNSKKTERLAKPAFNIFGAGCGNIQTEKLVINKNIPIIK